MRQEKEIPTTLNSIDLERVWDWRKWLSKHGFTEDDVREFLDNEPSSLSDREKDLVSNFELMLETSFEPSVDRICKPEELQELKYQLIQYVSQASQN